jgi:hypothetical protein
MKSFRADHIERDDPVRVSDGSWLPAAVVEVGARTRPQISDSAV